MSARGEIGYWEALGLKEPNVWLEPKDARAIARALEAHQGARPIGAGEHLARSIRVAVSMRAADRVLGCDSAGAWIEAEAGIGWGALQNEARAAKLSLDHCALRPSGATLGGLLARPLVPGAEADPRSHCLGARIEAGQGAYFYTRAPRKASGPDWRYDAFGAEGRGGLIVSAALGALPALDARLFAWPARDPFGALEIWGRLVRLGLRASWSWWEPGRLEAAAHGPASLLTTIERALGEAFGDDFDSAGAARALERRRALERDHPVRRSAPGAERRTHESWTRAEGAARAQELKRSGRLDAIAMTEFGRHGARAIVTYTERASAIAEARRRPGALLVWPEPPAPRSTAREPDPAAEEEP